MKTMMIVVFVMMLFCCSTVAAQEQGSAQAAAATAPTHLGACPAGDWTYLWTGKKGEVPSGKSCPAGTKPGVLGTCDEITGGREAQDALDTRRAEAVSPGSSWCTLARTTVCGQNGSDAAAVACIPDDAFGAQGAAPPGDVGERAQGSLDNFVDRAAATNVGVWNGCPASAGGSQVACAAAHTLKNGGVFNASLMLPDGSVARWDSQGDGGSITAKFVDLKKPDDGLSAGSAVAIVTIFTAAGTIIGAGFGGAYWPDEASADGFSTGGMWKGAAIGLGSGLVSGLATWGIAEAVHRARHDDD